MNTVMTPRRTLATAGRVLRQFSHDPRSVALLLLAPSLFIGLFAWLFSGSEGVFDRIGGPILAIFPFYLDVPHHLRDDSSGAALRDPGAPDDISAGQR